MRACGSSIMAARHGNNRKMSSFKAQGTWSVIQKLMRKSRWLSKRREQRLSRSLSAYSRNCVVGPLFRGFHLATRCGGMDLGTVAKSQFEVETWRKERAPCGGFLFLESAASH